MLFKEFVTHKWDFSSVQLMLPFDLNQCINIWADGNIPFSERHKKGIEKSSHITALYGLHSASSGDIRRKIFKFGPVKCKLAETDIFETEDFDVLYIKVKSQKLMELNQLLAELDHTNNHSEYKPHATICYLEKGEGSKYKGLKDFAQTITFNTADFSSKNGFHEEINLI